MIRHQATRQALAVLALISALPGAYALEVGEALPPIELEDASGSDVALLASHRRIYATADRKGGKLIERAMAELNQASLDNHGAVVITEISKAPGFVKGMIKSGLEDRSYVSWVDEAGRTRKLWPYRKNHVTVIDLNDYEVVAIRFERDLETLRELLRHTADRNAPAPESPAQEQD